jgi:hypothetical protein
MCGSRDVVVLRARDWQREEVRGGGREYSSAHVLAGWTLRGVRLKGSARGEEKVVNDVRGLHEQGSSRGP